MPCTFGASALRERQLKRCLLYNRIQAGYDKAVNTGEAKNGKKRDSRMFDTNKVADTIKRARTERNMTQMDLADEMGISYQAVSNWERGNSMPDISKLSDLCKILNISFEELVGERIPETDTVEKLLQDEHAEVSLKEMAQIGQLVRPEQMENRANEAVEKGEKLSLSDLTGLAPFVEKETLSRLAEEIAEVDLHKLCGIAPFLEEETLDAIVDRTLQQEEWDVRDVVGLAPFLSETEMQRIAERLVANDRAKDLVMIAPFMEKEGLSGVLERSHRLRRT